LIGIYGPNDDTLRGGLWEELENFLSLWDALGAEEGISMWSDFRSRGQLEED